MYLKLKNRVKDQNIEVEGEITLPKGYLINTKIRSLKCSVKGNLTPNNDLKMKVQGVIKTSNVYPFELEICDNVQKYLQNNQNSLDINLIVWENVILEIPINFMEETQRSFNDIIPESGRSE